MAIARVRFYEIDETSVHRVRLCPSVLPTVVTVTDDEVIATAILAGYILIEREVVPDRPMWGWVGTDLTPGWWPTRHLAIDHMRGLLFPD